LGLFLLSAATLAFEINLSRLFSVAQFYHFAFMIVSIALLGFGASGTVLAIYPRLAMRVSPRGMAWLSLAAGLSTLGAFLLINRLPFDSFSIAWDRRQVYILIFHYIVLAMPFFFTGLAMGSLITVYSERVGSLYAINLLGSALGCILAWGTPGWLGGEGTVLLCSGLAGLAALICSTTSAASREKGYAWNLVLSILLLVFSLAYWQFPRHWLELRLSPYKGLSYALQYPGAQRIFQRWNAFSRVDVVRSPGVRSFPGLSYRYLQPLPPQDGLFVDGDELSPILQPNSSPEFTAYLSDAVAFQLRPNASVLALEPRGGLDIVAALALGAQNVTAVEVNPLIVEAASHIYHQPGVQVYIESDRSYLRRRAGQFDIVILSLGTSYHPVRSGAYSLAEDYRHTVEAFQDAYHHLAPDGILVVNRWLQIPPSESLRAFALAATALERSAADPRQQIVALRGYNTATILVKQSPFTKQELALIRSFAAERAFDLVYAPGIRPEETNRFNILSESVYYQAFTSLLETQPRQAFYSSYPYDIAPPTDDHPFFGHYFKWSQAPQVLAELGKTWQPFGGAGYFVLLALLVLAVLLAGILILLPLGVARFVPGREETGLVLKPGAAVAPLVYFAAIGLAFLLAEIPLIHRFILYLGQPAYAMTTVLFSLLLFSGLGSHFSPRIPARLALGLLVILLILISPVLAVAFEATLGLPLSYRLGIGALLLAPLGFLMGIPFPAGLCWISSGFVSPASSKASIPIIPWIWGVNGAASVIAAVAAALLALTWGYSWVWRLSALCYAIAWITAAVAAPPAPAPRPPR
jgi:hypothetical protein